MAKDMHQQAQRLEAVVKILGDNKTKQIDYDKAAYEFWQIAWKMTSCMRLGEDMLRRPVPHLSKSFGQQWHELFKVAETWQPMEAYDHVRKNWEEDDVYDDNPGYGLAPWSPSFYPYPVVGNPYDEDEDDFEERLREEERLIERGALPFPEDPMSRSPYTPEERLLRGVIHHKGRRSWSNNPLHYPTPLARKVARRISRGTGTKPGIWDDVDAVLRHGESNPAYCENPWEASCVPLRPRGRRMTTRERHALPDEAFGWVHWDRAKRGGQRRPGRSGSWHKRRDYPMDDVVHARNAKARASKAYNMGRISKLVRDQIFRKADAIIRRCRQERELGLVEEYRRPRRRVAANPYHYNDPYHCYNNPRRSAVERHPEFESAIELIEEMAEDTGVSEIQVARDLQAHFMSEV
jgi:hypothetical protein